MLSKVITVLLLWSNAVAMTAATPSTTGDKASIKLMGSGAAITWDAGSGNSVSVTKKDAVGSSLSVNGTLTVDDIQMHQPPEEGMPDSMSTLIALVKSMNNRLAAAEDKITTLQDSLSAANETIAQLEADRDEALQRLASAESNISSAKAATAALRTDVESATVNVVPTKTVPVNGTDELLAAYNNVSTSCLADTILQLPERLYIDSPITFRGHPCDHRIIIRGVSSGNLVDTANYRVVCNCTSTESCIRFDPRVEEGGRGSIMNLRLEGFRLESPVSRAYGDPVSHVGDVHAAYTSVHVHIDNVVIQGPDSLSGGFVFVASYGARISASRIQATQMGFAYAHHEGTVNLRSIHAVGQSITNGNVYGVSTEFGGHALVLDSFFDKFYYIMYNQRGSTHFSKDVTLDRGTGGFTSFGFSAVGCWNCSYGQTTYNGPTKLSFAHISGTELSDSCVNC